ncbi:MAG: CoA transferase [Clostridia bacterium]|nr:CoA transferase [Clostridia bacterium]
MGALDDIRVIDLSQFEAGPMATVHLAEMGAEIIKIEKPKVGEQTRIGARTKNGVAGPGADSIHFSLLNGNKKSIELNTKSPKGKALLFELIKTADILVENFAPGTMERLGLSYDVLKEVNPRLIVGSVKGFDDKLPYGKYPCFDGVAQAMGGVASLTGEAGGAPMQSGANLADNMSGIYLAAAILGALHERERTGLGQYVRVNMQEVIIQTCRGAYVTQFEEGHPPIRYGNKKFVNRAPHDLYPCKPREGGDGSNDYVFLYVSPVKGSPQWPKFCDFIGKPEWAEDPIMSDPVKRAEPANRQTIDDVIIAYTMQHDKEDIMKAFSDAGLPAGAILSTNDIATDPIYKEAGIIQEVDHPTLGRIPGFGSPFHMSNSEFKLEPAPTLGQHNDEIYKGILKLTDEEIAALKEEGVL